MDSTMNQPLLHASTHWPDRTSRRESRFARMLRWLSAGLMLSSVGGCLGTSPAEARRQAIGDGDYDLEEEHNPGKPCLACHDRDFHPGGDVFAVAGTVYLRASDPDERGLAGVDVFIRDAVGRELHAVTNDAGNFMVEVDPDEAGEHEDGRLTVADWPEYPLEVRISQGDMEQRMLTPIHREGSCAGCHDGEADATSVGRVFLQSERP